MFGYTNLEEFLVNVDFSIVTIMVKSGACSLIWVQ